MVMRELMPQTLTFDLDRLTKEEAVAAARYLAGVVGKAHGRQMNPKTAKSRAAELKGTTRAIWKHPAGYVQALCH